MNIPKGEEAAEALIAEVEALFELDVKQRALVLHMAGVTTDHDQPDRTYEDFFRACGLSSCRIQGQPLETHNEILPDGTPDGGWAEAPGLAIRWQKGALNFEEGEVSWNGCFLVTLLQVAEAQLEFYENSKYACNDNADALVKVREAMEILNRRQIRRFCCGVRGKHEM